MASRPLVAVETRQDNVMGLAAVCQECGAGPGKVCTHPLPALQEQQKYPAGPESGLGSRYGEPLGWGRFHAVRWEERRRW